MGMIGDLFVKLGLKSDDFNKGIDQAKGKTSEFGSAMGKIGGLIAGAFSVGAIINFVGKLVSVRSEFEKYEAVLTNTLGSQQAARQEMQMLQNFASSTPFALSELTGAFVKLTNYGLKPSQEEMRKYGDLASSTGKGFDQLVEGIADATTGQFERLKEFGIKASQEGSKVSFVFKGQQTTVANTSKAIKDYILGLGSAEGVTGSMAAISATLGGRINNLGDAWSNMLNTMGKGTSGIFVSVINWATDMVDGFALALKTIKQIKQEVGDKQTATNTAGALAYINELAEKYKGRGKSAKEAEKAALAAYNSERVQNELTLTDQIGKAKTDKEKEYLEKKLQMFKDEYEAVNAHFAEIGKATIAKTKKQLDDEAKEKKESFDRGVKELSDKTNQETAILTDKFRNEKIKQDEYNYSVSRLLIAQYEKELSLAKKFGQDVGEIEKKIAEERYRMKQEGAQKMVRRESLTEASKSDQLLGIKPKEQDKNQLRFISSTMTADQKEEAEAMERKKQAMGQFLNDFNGLIQSGMAQAATTFGEGIGALLSGDMNFKDFGKSLLAVVGQFLVQFGQLLISFAIASSGLQAAIKTPGAWPVALAAGIALVAIGSAISSLSKKGLSSGGGGSSTASGGGSYIAPSNGRQAQAEDNKVVFEIQGSKLVGVLNNAEKRKLNLG